SAQQTSPKEPPAPAAPPDKAMPSETGTAAPDLAQLKVIFQDDFDNPQIKPAFPEGRWTLNNAGKRPARGGMVGDPGYGQGCYFGGMCGGEGTSHWTNNRTYLPHVLDVTAKLVNAKADVDHWYVNLWRAEGNGQPAHDVSVHVRRDGMVVVKDGDPTGD